MKRLLSIPTAAVVLVSCAASAEACRMHVTDPATGRTFWMPRPNKAGGSGLPPPPGFGGPALGAPAGSGLPVDEFGPFGDMIIKFYMTTPALPVDGPGADQFSLEFVNNAAQVMVMGGSAGTFNIDFPVLTGGMTMLITEGDPSGGTDTFTTIGGFTLSGVGMGTDGRSYAMMLTSSGAAGNFGPASLVNGTQFTDDVIDIFHPIATQSFFDVFISLSEVVERGPLSFSSNVGTIQCDGYTSCGEMTIPAPGVGAVATVGLLALRRRRRG